ncbi:MAG: uracil-DNA glycosylase [Ardenticatenales bacterium]|nr:uracil-DNA glycosylase [Ardenticatenales bacterium]
MAAHVRACTRCPLSATRKHAVPGEGPVDASLMFIGEGPGANEDRTGRPFVGNAGQFLEELLATIGLTREDVFITNIVKCRPPNNRDPLPNEIDACKPYLGHQLKIIDPEIIVTLGRFAMERWLPDKRITRVHGQSFRYGRRLIVPMFHPAAALRNPEWRTFLEEDFLRLPEIIEEARAMREAPPDEETFSAEQPRLL